MLEAVDKVAEEHERNVRVTLLLLSGLRALDDGPADPAAVAESFLLKLLSLSGFHPALTACAVCGATDSAAVRVGPGRRRVRGLRRARRRATSRARRSNYLAALALAELGEVGRPAPARRPGAQGVARACSSGSPSTTSSGG